MNCARNGCTGTIVDGYCDVCGMAPARPAAPPSPGPEQPPDLDASNRRRAR